MVSLVIDQRGNSDRERVRRARLALIALAWLFAAGIAVEIGLAGLSAASSAAPWTGHVTVGRWLGIVPVPLLLVAVVGRLPVRLVVQIAALVVLSALQGLFVHAGAGSLAALHPLSAVVLLGLTMRIGSGVRALLNSQPPERIPHD